MPLLSYAPAPVDLDDPYAALCAQLDPLLSGDDRVLDPTAQVDLRAFARLFDLPLEDATDAEVWRAVRPLLLQDITPQLVIEPSNDEGLASESQAA